MQDYFEQLEVLKPSPDLSPQQVISIQLESLQNNDLSRGDQGMRICFRFASPGNQVSTGPVEHFIEMLKSPLYRPMVGFERAEFSEVSRTGNIAQQTVRLVRGKGESAVFIFMLSRQMQEPYIGCWMTDAVLRVA